MPLQVEGASKEEMHPEAFVSAAEGDMQEGPSEHDGSRPGRTSYTVVGDVSFGVRHRGGDCGVME